MALASGTLEETVVPIDNPFRIGGVAGTVASVAGFTGLVLWFISMLAALVSLVLRFRASRGTERQQLRWVVAGAVGAVAGLVDAFAVRLRDQVDLTALHAELLAVVDQTVAPTQASLWLRPPAVGPGLPR